MGKAAAILAIVVCAWSAYADPAAGAASATSSQIQILELNTEGKLAFAAVTRPNVSIPLTLENRGAQALKGVTVAVSPFTASTGEIAQASAAPASVDVPAGATGSFSVTATLPAPGTYIAHGRVMKGARRLLTFKLEVARTKAKPPIDIGDVSAIQQTANIGHSALAIPVTMRLYATEGPASIPPPVLHSASRKDKIDSAAGHTAEAVIDVSSVPNPIAVAPGKAESITLTLDGVGSPGRYDVKVRFPAPGFEIIEKDITLFVRDPWWLALVLITLGVLLSLWVNAYGRVRARLLLQQRVAAVLAILRDLRSTAKTARARQLAGEIHDAVTRQWNTARFARQPLAPHIDVYERIAAALPAWVRQWEASSRARPLPVREALMRTLETAAAAFTETPPVAETVNASISTLRQFPTTVRTAIEQELEKQLTALDQELARDTRAVSARLRSALLQVRDKLAAGQLEAAVGTFDSVRLQYAALLAEDLLGRVSAAAAPTGMSAADWNVLSGEVRLAVNAVRSECDADKAMPLIKRAMKQYLLGVLAALRGAAKSLGAGAAAKPVTDALDAAEHALGTDKLGEAWQQLDEATARYAAATTGGKLGAAATAADALQAGGFDLMEAVDVPPPAADLDLPAAPEAIEGRITRNDMLVSALVLLVAVLVGLQVLWLDNPTWGGWPSYLGAFVWGFALDRFTHAGIKALQPK